MAYLLEDLEVDRVDLVDEGANSASSIELYKRKEQSDIMELKDIIAKMTPEHAAVVQAELDKLNGDVAKAKETVEALTTERDKFNTELAKAKEDLKASSEELNGVKAENDTLKASTASFDEEQTIKSMPEAARELYLKMKAQKDVAEEEVRKAKEASELATAIAKAAELKSLPIESDKLVNIVKSASKELMEVLTSINEAIGDTVLGTVGKSNTRNTSSDSKDEAWGKIEKMAGELVKTNKSLTHAAAVSQVVNENPELYRQYVQGGAN